ncbi:hypothetical protein KFK09_022215 [Dendrobium nobile]|uniref:Uncharacterized protein n=1 Tax=Dendrobium nobile TaxID=94219 RepID=A0A8T3AID3_DENNO|nr:hypothetical protein KFK09_022215 [Dendrobium nobile]
MLGTNEYAWYLLGIARYYSVFARYLLGICSVLLGTTRYFLGTCSVFARYWLRLSLSFVPFASLSPVTASSSLLYLWADPSPSSSSSDSKPPKSPILCNPLTRSFRILPPLGSAWSRHGTVLAALAIAGSAVLVLTELAALSYSPGTASWLKFSLNLPSKPRSPVIIGVSIYTLCDTGNPWRSQWKLFSCAIDDRYCEMEKVISTASGILFAFD